MFLGANNRVAGLFKASFEPPAPRTLIPVDVDSNRQPTLDRSVFITKQLANARLIVLLLPILDQLLCTPNIGFQTLNYPFVPGESNSYTIARGLLKKNEMKMYVLPHS